MQQLLTTHWAQSILEGGGESALLVSLMFFCRTRDDIEVIAYGADYNSNHLCVGALIIQSGITRRVGWSGTKKSP